MRLVCRTRYESACCKANATGGHGTGWYKCDECGGDCLAATIKEATWEEDLDEDS